MLRGCVYCFYIFKNVMKNSNSFPLLFALCLLFGKHFVNTVLSNLFLCCCARVCWQGVWRRAVWPHCRKGLLHRDGCQSAHSPSFGRSQLFALHGHCAQRPEGTAVFIIHNQTNEFVVEESFCCSTRKPFQSSCAGGNPCYSACVSDITVTTGDLQ